jgi:hypothetical protein
MSDWEDDPDEPVRRRTPRARVYIHHRCGGQTQVSGDDYTHICDPFRLCTGTYCCQCAGFVSLGDVSWTDTGEPISEYRTRLRAETPGLVRAWRSGLGLLLGGVAGALLGLLVLLIVGASSDRAGVFALVGGLAGAFLGHAVGAAVLNRVYDIDYRRMK